MRILSFAGEVYDRFRYLHVAGRAGNDRLADHVEKVRETVLPSSKCALCVHRKETAHDTRSLNHLLI